MPEAVHPAKDRLRVLHAERLHPDDRDVERAHHPQNHQVRQKEAGDGNQGVGDKGTGPIVGGTAADRGVDPYGKREAPDDQRLTDEEWERIEEALPDLGEDRLAILERFQLARGQVTHPVDILEVKWLVEVEGGADTGNVLRLHARIRGVYCARLAGSEVRDRVSQDRNKHQ